MFPEGRAFEFLIVAIAALVFVGPKDLPALLRKLGQFMAKVRSMAAEFRASFDEMARQSELDELRKEVEAMRSAQMSDIAAHLGAPEVTQTFDELSQGLSDVGVHMTPTGYQVAQTETIEVAEAPKPRRAAVKPSASKRVAAKTQVPKKAAAVRKASPKAPAKAAPKVAPAPKPRAKAKPAPAAETVTPARPRARESAGTVT